MDYNNMTNAQLILRIHELEEEIKKLSEQQRPSKGRIITSGSPDYVRRFVKVAQERLKDERRD